MNTLQVHKSKVQPFISLKIRLLYARTYETLDRHGHEFSLLAWNIKTKMLSHSILFLSGLFGLFLKENHYRFRYKDNQIVTLFFARNVIMPTYRLINYEYAIAY